MPREERLDVPCCPELSKNQNCDALDFHYRLTHQVSVPDDNRRPRQVAVEVLLHARLERCTEGLALGDLAYTTTLFPGERVRLFSADRRTRFSYDRESSLSYRHEQTSEEHYFMSSMSDFMSDLTVRDDANSSRTNSGSIESRGSASGPLETLFAGASVSASGSWDAQSTADFSRELSRHASASHDRSVEATRTANSVSVGEVQSRVHAEGESEDHFEAASRSFHNPNRCHAVTYYFYQLDKVQVVRFSIVAIERRVIDPGVNSMATNNRFESKGGVSVIPTAILATDEKRLEIESRAQQSVQASKLRVAASPMAVTSLAYVPFTSASVASVASGPTLTPDMRAAALKAVDADLVREKMIDPKTGKITEEKKRELSLEIRSALPTPGLLVRGCLDDCSVCEPALEEEIQLDLERKKLENQLLARQIDLLDQSQEYRCCPEGDDADDDD